MFLQCIQHFNSGFRTCDIVFSKEANSFHWVCLFCISVRNTVYVISKNWLQVVLLARSHNFFHRNCHFCLSWSITKPQKTQTRVLSCFLNKLKLTHFLHIGQKIFRFPEIFLIFMITRVQS